MFQSHLSVRVRHQCKQAGFPSQARHPTPTLGSLHMSCCSGHISRQRDIPRGLGYLCRMRGKNVKNHVGRAGEVSQQLKAWTALAEDLSSVPSTQVRQLTAVCKLQLQEVLAPLASKGTCTVMAIPTHRHIQFLKTINPSLSLVVVI